MERINFFKFLVFLVATAVLARLFYWQFLSKIPSKLSYTEEDLLPAPRGQILASDGFPLVTNQEAFLLYAKPHELKNNPQDIAKNLAPFLISEKYATAEASLSEQDQKNKEDEIKNREAEILKKITDKVHFWVQLKRKVTLTEKNKIAMFNFAGIVFEKDEKRLYPEASMAAHLLGFVGSDKFGQDTGYFGLEGFYDRELRGTPGRPGTETDPFGFPILIGKYHPVEPKKGANLTSTIDRVVQFIAEQKLKDAVEKYGAKEGSVIIADPKSGHIIAMATYPNYNPDLFALFDQKYFRNPAVADIYEPGSTFKLVTMSAALDTGIVTPETKCNVCNGPRQIGGFEISTWNKKYYPDSTMTQVIEHSDNVGMTFVGEKLGLDKLYSYITKFGLGQRTGIDLQEESTGVLRAKKDWRPIDLATASFGQGIAVTPIQMVQAVSTIANGGKLISPKVVAEIKRDSASQKVKPEAERQVISPKTAAQITEMMVNAVERGEARVFAPQGWRIAGKTGTAQIPLAGHYDPNKTVASFVGFAPADNPKFVMLVRFTEPSSSPFGSETAAPTFFTIAKDLFNYWAIPPQK